MRYLAERNIGYDTGVVRVPIVPGAVLFDLALGRPDVRPDAAMGYAACQAATADSAEGNVGAGTGATVGKIAGLAAASSDSPAEGNVGAGTGATVGKIAGLAAATKGGLGQAALRAGDLVVAALIAVIAFGDVIDPRQGRIVAGARGPAGFLDTAAALRQMPAAPATLAGNTVIGVVATNARLDVAQANEMATAAHDGLARVVRPAHTLYDGDTLFGLATGAVGAPFVVVADLAAEVTARAIVNAVWAAQGAAGLPAARDLCPAAGC
jgi:L-aminopeptidase/D-esterase-like protein